MSPAVIPTGRAVFALLRETEVTFLGAAIAYYALLSVVPALLLAVAVATWLGGEALAEQVLAATGELLTPVGQGTLEVALTSSAGRAGASVFGLVVLLWSTLRVFRGLDQAFSRVYDTSGADSLAQQFRDAAVGVIAVGAGFWAMLALAGLLSALSLPVGHRLLGLVVLLGGLFAAFLPFYYVFPDARVTVPEIVPGAAIAAVGWVVLQAAFQAYATVAPAYELYGVLGGVLLLVTWFYLGATLLLVGAAVNVVLAGRVDRQGEKPADRASAPSMDGSDGEPTLEEQVSALREAVEALETRLEEHTVPRSEVESDLKQYVRARLRRGRARGWGPYLVLLYGTAMTVGAFYLLSGGWAVLAMVVIWLSTLGLYVVMVLAGAAIGAIELPGRAVDAVRDRRS